MTQPFLPYGRQDIQDTDIDAVVSVLKSDFLTQGPAVPRFEHHVAQRVGAKHAVAVNSATSALHIACAALDLGPGDCLWTSPVTFVASANCALYCGARVDFVDTDPATANMCPDHLAQKLAKADAEGTLPKVIVPVHLTGQSCDMAKIAALAKRYNIRVIEDASHAIGGAYLGAPVGSCAHSDIVVFSFHPVKIVTSGEGGMAITNDAGLARKMERLRSHGITRDVEEMTGPSDGSWYYQQIELGWNYRLTDIQAALGVAQLDRLDDYVTKRNMLADRYDDRLQNLAVTRPGRLTGAYSAWHLYVVRVPEAQHKDVFEKMRSAGLGVNLHYIPVHLQPYYAQFGFSPGDFPNSEAYYRSAISIPLFPTLAEADQDRVVTTLTEALGK